MFDHSRLPTWRWVPQKRSCLDSVARQPLGIGASQLFGWLVGSRRKGAAFTCTTTNSGTMTGEAFASCSRAQSLPAREVTQNEDCFCNVFFSQHSFFERDEMPLPQIPRKEQPTRACSFRCFLAPNDNASHLRSSNAILLASAAKLCSCHSLGHGRLFEARTQISQNFLVGANEGQDCAFNARLRFSFNSQ